MPSLMVLTAAELQLQVAAQTRQECYRSLSLTLTGCTDFSKAGFLDGSGGGTAEVQASVQEVRGEETKGRFDE
jgi:hypothetical protein